jgi:hypothetical protein
VRQAIQALNLMANGNVSTDTSLLEDKTEESFIEVRPLEWIHPTSRRWM